MRTVGKQIRDEFILNIEEAMYRGAQLDNMLVLASMPRVMGVRRMTHAQMNAEDQLRSLQMAKSVNQPCS